MSDPVIIQVSPQNPVLTIQPQPPVILTGGAGAAGVGGGSGGSGAASGITVTPTGTISSTNVQAAIAEIDGDVQLRIVGPSSATDSAVALFNGTTGKLIKDSLTILDTDVTLAANLDTHLPTQKAVKTYIDQKSLIDSVATLTASATLVAGTSAHTQILDGTTAGFTVTLPLTTLVGVRYLFKRIDAVTANTINITGGTSGIEGSTTLSIFAQWDFIELESTGVSGNWRIIDGSRMQFVSYINHAEATVTRNASVGPSFNSPGINLMNCASGALTVTLPNSTTFVNLSYTVKKIDSSANAVSIVVSSAGTVDGQATYLLTRQYQSVVVTCSSAGIWNVISENDGMGFDSDGTLTANSDLVVATQKATKTYVDALKTTVTNGLQGSQIDVFTSSGTWTKPTWSATQTIIAIGGGGGGASGARFASGSIVSGGAGGGGAGLSIREISSTLLGASETVTIGAAGSGGTSRTVDGSTGAAGNSGGTTTFGGWLRAYPGAGGGAATGTGATGGSGGNGTTIGGGGANATAGAVGSLGGQGAGCPGGGSGGGISVTPAAFAGGAGQVPSTNPGIAAGGTSGAIGAAGGNGTDATANSGMPGSSGGAGGASITAVGGNGGNAGLYGAGGGGGGSSLNGFNSGAGGNGSAGIVIIISYPASGTLGISSAGKSKVTIYATPGSGTHNVDTRSIMIEVEGIAGGNGGGGGAVVASGTACSGGGGGCGGSWFRRSIPVSALSSLAVAYQVGAGGTGGASQPSTAQIAGNSGGGGTGLGTMFGIAVPGVAYYGAFAVANTTPNQGGQIAANAAGTTNIGQVLTTSSTNTNGTAGLNAVNNAFAGAVGASAGGGGGISTTPAQFAGGAGAPAYGSTSNTAPAGGAAGGGAGVTGNASGLAGLGIVAAGSGGGGGGSNITGAGGNGGNGVSYGGGGGGGGSSLVGIGASGAGGTGAQGILIVREWF